MRKIATPSRTFCDPAWGTKSVSGLLPNTALQIDLGHGYNQMQRDPKLIVHGETKNVWDRKRCFSSSSHVKPNIKSKNRSKSLVSTSFFGAGWMNWISFCNSKRRCRRFQFNPFIHCHVLHSAPHGDHPVGANQWTCSDGIFRPWETKHTFRRFLTKELVHINLVVLVLVLKKQKERCQKVEEHISGLKKLPGTCLEPWKKQMYDQISESYCLTGCPSSWQAQQHDWSWGERTTNLNFLKFV